jgi:hypothetical protein
MPINMFFIVKNHWQPYFTDNLVLQNNEYGIYVIGRAPSQKTNIPTNPQHHQTKWPPIHIVVEKGGELPGDLKIHK